LYYGTQLKTQGQLQLHFHN